MSLQSPRTIEHIRQYAPSSTAGRPRPGYIFVIRIYRIHSYARDPAHKHPSPARAAAQRAPASDHTSQIREISRVRAVTTTRATSDCTLPTVYAHTISYARRCTMRPVDSQTQLEPQIHLVPPCVPSAPSRHGRVTCCRAVHYVYARRRDMPASYFRALSRSRPHVT